MGGAIVIRVLLVALKPQLRWLMLWGLRLGAAGVFVWFLQGIATHIPSWPLVGRLRGVFASAAMAVEHFVQANLATEALKAQPHAVAFVGALANVIEDASDSTALLASHTFGAIEIITHGTIPAVARAERPDVGRLRRAAATTAGLAALALALAERAYHKAVAVTLPHALPWVGKEVGRAEHKATQALRGLRSVRNLLAAGVLGGLIVKTLTRAGTGNIYCRNLKNVNRRVCGADPHLLETLLGGLTLIIGTVSLIEFARACQTVEGEIIDGVHSFLRP